jgi:hypothetical protein
MWLKFRQILNIILWAGVRPAPWYCLCLNGPLYQAEMMIRKMSIGGMINGIGKPKY